MAWAGRDVIARLNNEAHHLLSRSFSLTYEKITEESDVKVETSATEAGGGIELNANLFSELHRNVFVKLTRGELVSRCRSI